MSVRCELSKASGSLIYILKVIYPWEVHMEPKAFYKQCILFQPVPAWIFLGRLLIHSYMTAVTTTEATTEGTDKRKPAKFSPSSPLTTTNYSLTYYMHTAEVGRASCSREKDILRQLERGFNSSTFWLWDNPFYHLIIPSFINFHSFIYSFYYYKGWE